MDICVPETPLTQCHRCLRRRPAHAVQPIKRDGLRSPPAVIDASTVLIDGRCQFRVDCASLGQAALEVGAPLSLRETNAF